MHPPSWHSAPRYLATIALGFWLASPLASNPSFANPPSGPTPTLHVIAAWIRWLPAGLPAAGYLTLTNTGGKAVDLKAASSPAYGDVSIHRSIKHGTTEEMTPVEDIMIEPHQTLAFESTGYHLMLMQPRSSADTDAAIPITLEFADGSSMTVPFQVRKNPGAPSAPPRP